MTTADAVIGWIEANYLGKGEPFPPKGGEWIPFQESWGYPAGMMVEWCGGLQCEAVRQTGGTVSAAGTIPNTWYTVSGVQQFMARGDWVPADGSQQPQRGWLVYYDWGGGGFITTPAEAGSVDHVGIVTDGSMWSEATGWAFETIEGNVDERCGRFRRYDNETVVGFGKPRYTPVVVPPEPEPDPKPPVVVPPPVVVVGAIGERWRAIGGDLSPVGKPVANEQPFLGAARVQRFERGHIVWSAATGAAELYGEIGKRWWADGAKVLGLPTSGEWDADGPGWRWQQFQYGRILFTPPGGARIIKGAILMHYIGRPAAERLALGPLLTDEIDAKASVFESGDLVWNPRSGVAVTR